ncbi:MAG: DUF1934 domain-containing protein [Oscillospiraceae bacterium]|nr:DUF1934 domain-containing protein [Oscillospiraceae bacterium]
MKKTVLVRILSQQQYEGEQPDISEFMSVGTLEVMDNSIAISYEESELTGLEGTTTTFLLEKDRITLRREGKLRSEMVFAINREHRSLYDMGMGALLITVRTTALVQAVGSEGGFVDVAYDLLVEDSQAGQIRYHLDVSPLPPS